MKKIKLSPRLEAVASFVKTCNCAADIGTDHGFIPVYLLQNGLCKKAIASDINEGPLQSAVRTAHTYSVSKKIDFVCRPGLDGIDAGEADTVIIAGMGGETIVEILKAAPWIKDCGTHIILQPQSKYELLQQYLYSNGFEAECAKLVYDSGRLYIVLSVKYTGNAVEKDITYFADKLENDPLISDYASLHLKKLMLREKGLMSAANIDEAELGRIRKTAEYLRSFISED